MRFHTFLLKYGEIGIKGKNRYLFEDALVRQVRRALEPVDGEFQVYKSQARIYVDCEGDYDYEDAVEHLKRVFGLVGICPVVRLEDQGFEVTRVPVDSRGNLSMEELAAAIREDTILVSAMYVNNELGAVLPVEEIGALIKEKNPDTLFHADAIQAYGKYRIFPKKMKIDLLSVSSHKIHGPKGAGFLYIGEKVKIHPLILGGGQQKGMRSGTDNVPGIAGMGEAARIIYEHLEENTSRMRELKEYFRGELEKIDNVEINGPVAGEGAPHILNASFLGVRSEVLLHALEDQGIYVSAGSACSSHKRTGSPSLGAIGLSPERKESAVRFSFSEFTTKEELDYTLETLKSLLPMLRRYARR